MPWVRLDENAMDHPKLAGISDAAFRLWVYGLSHCQKFLTDGVIGKVSLKGLRFYTPRRAQELVDARLWDPAADGAVQVHDYLEWNESRDSVLENREWGRRRRELYSDPSLLSAIRQRDGDFCRYCGKQVNWRDRRGPDGGTYDHVVARGPNSLENLVVACRGCNSSKGDRGLEDCKMVLLPAPNLVPDLVPKQNRINQFASGVVCSSKPVLSVEMEGGVGETIAERAGEFCQWYEAAHQRIFGIGYMGTNNDYTKAVELAKKFTDAQMRDAAIVWFGMDDDFATKGTRTVPKFASRITACLQAIRERGIA